MLPGTTLPPYDHLRVVCRVCVWGGRGLARDKDTWWRRRRDGVGREEEARRRSERRGRDAGAGVVFAEFMSGSKI